MVLPPVMPQLLQNVVANSASLNALVPPHHATAPPNQLNTGLGANAKVYSPGNGIGEQAVLGEQLGAPGLDAASGSVHGRSGSNTGALGANVVSVVSSADNGKGGSRGGNGQIASGPKQAELKLGSQMPPSLPSDTATSAPDLDEAKSSGHGRSGSKEDASDGKGRNDVAVAPLTGSGSGPTSTSKPGLPVPPHFGATPSSMVRKAADAFKSVTSSASTIK